MTAPKSINTLDTKRNVGSLVKKALSSIKNTLANAKYNKMKINTP
jgi:hypothetical protein